MVAVHQIMTFNSSSSHQVWTSQTQHCHMCSQHVGLLLNQQVDGYLCTYVAAFIMKTIIYYPFSPGCHFWLGNNQLRWQSANNFAEGMWCTTFILRLLKTGFFFRQMSRLSQGAHATTYQPTEAELQTRWSAWASWRVELILARRVTNPTVSHFNSN